MSAGRKTPRSVWAVLPAKSFARGKSRLGTVLDDAARSALARHMFAHVLGLTRACPGLTGTLVITDGDDVAELAAAGGAHVLRDPATDMTLAQIADTALASLPSRGADAALILMADLPRLEPADLQALLVALTQADVVLAADRAGMHTNALGLRLEHGFATCFGSTHSLEDHGTRARALGLRVQLIESAGLACDIDTEHDLQGNLR